MKYNNNPVTNVLYNGNQLNLLKVNGTKVWAKQYYVIYDTGSYVTRAFTSTSSTAVSSPFISMSVSSPSGLLQEKQGNSVVSGGAIVNANGRYLNCGSGRVYDTGSEVLRSVGNHRDRKNHDGTITRNIGYIPDLSQLTWNFVDYGGGAWTFYASVSETAYNIPNPGATLCEALSSEGYECINSNTIGNKTNGVYINNKTVYIKTSSQSVYPSGELNFVLNYPHREQGTSWTEEISYTSTTITWQDSNSNTISVPQGCVLFNGYGTSGAYYDYGDTIYYFVETNNDSDEYSYSCSGTSIGGNLYRLGSFNLVENSYLPNLSSTTRTARTSYWRTVWSGNITYGIPDNIYTDTFPMQGIDAKTISSSTLEMLTTGGLYMYDDGDGVVLDYTVTKCQAVNTSINLAVHQATAQYGTIYGELSMTCSPPNAIYSGAFHIDDIYSQYSGMTLTEIRSYY